MHLPLYIFSIRDDYHVVTRGKDACSKEREIRFLIVEEAMEVYVEIRKTFCLILDNSFQKNVWIKISDISRLLFQVLFNTRSISSGHT